MFVGESGVQRVVKRACELMKQPGGDVRALGGVDLPTIQKYLNFHFSVTSDLYGSEVSSNAANYYTGGLKGRFDETKIGDDHRLEGSSYPVPEIDGTRLTERAVPALTALNERLRDDWITDVAAGVERWNRVTAKAGVPFRFKLPHKGFHRRIGVFSGVNVTPEGQIIGAEEWARRSSEWLPTEEDRAYVNSLMGRVAEPGRFANWIAPPAVGINRQPVDFAYVRFN